MDRPRIPLLGCALFLALTAPLLAAGSAPAGGPVPRPSDADGAFFEARVRPLLAKHCYACHSQKIAQGGLRLDHAAALRRGGDGGPVLVPGKPDESRLIEAVTYTNPKLQMPPSGKLSEAELRILTEWVRRGAPWPSAGGQAEGETGGALSLEAGKRFWSIRPLRVSSPPAVKRKNWVRRRLDAYVLARLERAGLQPSPAADRRTLIRRVSFGLLGLPPTPEAVDAFVNDPSPSAYPRLVDDLLASPHYGERWGRHWLDLVRYCDVPESWAQTDAQAWRYRDWVVRALNEDMPYDRFVLRQLAADELPDTASADLAALGFLGLSPTYWKELKLAPDVIKTVVAEEWEERIDMLTRTTLGLTVACARCHDHKFDPISTADYYGLAGVFASTRLAPRPLLPAEQARQVLAAREQVAALEAEAKKHEEQAARAPDKADGLKRQAAAAREKAELLRRATPGFDAPTVYGVETAALQVLPDGPDRTRLAYRESAGQDVPLQVRGNPSRSGPVVPRRFLAVLSPGEPARFASGSGRLELGDAIFRDAAPLAARVIVNRVWRHHFGRGLVETPSDFGTQGDRPSHPELLDDLAARLIRSGWSLKWLHREVLLSAAYQQRSGAEPPAGERSGVADPENRLLGRMNRRRLEVEAWRDAILAAAGVLDRSIGGPPADLSDPGNVRRTLYGTVRRRELDDLLRLYDFPDPIAHSPARFNTTTPLQQLFVLNSGFVQKQAAALAGRLRSEVPGDTAGQVRRAYLLLYGRRPTAGELETAAEFLGAPQGTEPDGEKWNDFLQVLLARGELLFID